VRLSSEERLSLDSMARKSPAARRPILAATGGFVAAESFWRIEEPFSSRETRRTLRFPAMFGAAEAESGIPDHPHLSLPWPNNSVMAAWESPTIPIPTLLRNRS